MKILLYPYYLSFWLYPLLGLLGLIGYLVYKFFKKGDNMEENNLKEEWIAILVIVLVCSAIAYLIFRVIV